MLPLLVAAVLPTHALNAERIGAVEGYGRPSDQERRRAGRGKPRTLPPPARDPLRLTDPTWMPPFAGPRGQTGTLDTRYGLRFESVYAAPPGPAGLQADEAICIVNTAPQDRQLAGASIVVDGQGELRVHADLILSPNEVHCLAHDAESFRSRFGRNPTAASLGAKSGVAILGSPWVPLSDKQGVLRLIVPKEGHVDTLAYKLTPGSWVPKNLPLWTGPAWNPKDSTMINPRVQLISRDRDARGRVLADRDGAEDYDSGSWYSGWGDDPLHRLRLPGQSMFFPAHRHYRGGEVVATSSPDNNFSALVHRFRMAKREILVSVYQFTSGHLLEALLAAAERGVHVRLFVEGSPVAGLKDRSRWIYWRVQRAGGEVLFLGSQPKQNVKKRYRYDHSKYAIIDGEWSVIGTENYGSTGHPPFPGYGNRGWEIQIRSKGFAAELRKVWDADSSRAHRDVIGIDDSLSDKFGGKPFKKQDFRPVKKKAPTLRPYQAPAQPLHFKGAFGAQLVLSPDNSLSETDAVLGRIRFAKRRLILLQNRIRTRWGRAKKKVRSILVDAVVAAARRGVEVRVLLDGKGYQLDPDAPDGNDDTVRYFNALAGAEGLDLRAKVVDLDTLGLAKIHAKGVIVDDEWVFVGSQNWSENSFRANREVGVMLHSPAVASYYLKLFWRDWHGTRLYDARMLQPFGPPGRGLPKGAEVAVHVELGETCIGTWQGLEHTFPCDHLDLPVTSASMAHMLRGRKVRVVGRVGSVYRGRRETSLNLGEDWRMDFSVRIPRQLADSLSQGGLDIGSWVDQAIEVDGVVVERNGPAIVVKTLERIRLRD